jgi:Family of unknown function (DUF6441)
MRALPDRPRCRFPNVAPIGQFRTRPLQSTANLREMILRFSLSVIAKAFVDTITTEIQRPIAKAATPAIREAGEIAKQNGRASIAAAGFSRKWQKRVNIYPPQGDSLRPAAFIFHKIRYASVFEEGAVIGGQPLLFPACR